MTAIFYIAGTIAIATALLMVTARDPLKAALSLVVCFFSLSAIYVAFSAPFVAAIQLIVYAGAIMVFFVIVIMMLDPAVSREKARAGRILAGMAGAGAFLYFLGGSITQRGGYGGDVSRGFGSTESIGRAIFNRDILPFEVLSFLLLAAMIGAVILAKKEKP